MKAAVTGASGIQGISAMIYLLEQEDVEEIQVSDVFHLDRLEERVRRLDDKRLVMRSLDCTDQAAATDAFRGYDLVVHCAHTPGRAAETMKAALASGIHYVDLGSPRDETQQLALHREFEKRGLI